MIQKELKSKLASGFTLIEMLVSVAVMAAILAVAGYLIRSVIVSNRQYSESLAAQDSARRAMRIMSGEIRILSPSSTGAYAISEAAANSFTFYVNIDEDSYKERVRYFKSGNALKRGIVKPSGNPLAYDSEEEMISIVADNIANTGTPVFSYYDSDYDGTTDPLSEPINVSDVRLIKIMLIIDRDNSSPPGPITLTTQVSLRNLKDNL